MNPKTNEQLARKIEILNKKYFDGKLRIVCNFKTRKSTRCLGTCSYDRRANVCKIEINPLLKGYDINETLLHEMIHAKNFMDYGKSSHGDIFKKEARLITIKSEGKYTFKSTTTDKKLNEVVSNYTKEQNKKKWMKKYNLKTEKEYDDFIKAIMSIK